MYSFYNNYCHFESTVEEKYTPINNTKIINLIIYNPIITYEVEMKTILTNYLKSVPNLVFYFITLREQVEEYIIDDINNIMYINGHESFIPGILNKTISAIEYCNKNIDYDYIIRSNISTIIDFSKLNLNHDFMSCYPIELQWIDPKAGIHNNNLIGTKFASGTSIIMSKKSILYLLEHKHELDTTVIDDVSIGDVLSKYKYLEKIGNMSINDENENAICYRNRIVNPSTNDVLVPDNNRDEDVKRMKRIIQKIKK